MQQSPVCETRTSRLVRKLRSFIANAKERTWSETISGLASVLTIKVRGKSVWVLAWLYRRVMLSRVVFVGITGSSGKTTSKDLVVSVLSPRFRCSSNRMTANLPNEIAKFILRCRPSVDVHVQEVAAAHAQGLIVGGIERSLAIVKPRIGVVTNIGSDHRSAFKTLENTAAEKGKLVAGLPADGFAILNADDPYVSAMSSRTKARVLTYGLAPHADVRGVDVQSAWPGPLSMTVSYKGQSSRVRTRLHGKFFAHNVLASIGVGISVGMSLQEAVAGLSEYATSKGRMCEIQSDAGITFMDDRLKAPASSIPLVLEFLADASAQRKVVVLGQLSDYSGNSNRYYKSVAKQALEVADQVVFVGPRSSKALKARRHPDDESLQAFYSAEEATAFLRAYLKPGDLVLLKGPSIKADLQRFEGAADASNSAGAAGQTVERSDERHARVASDRRCSATSPDGDGRASLDGSPSPAHIIAGLGNIGHQYTNTRHNAGQRVVDRIAGLGDSSWQREDECFVARSKMSGLPVFLVKTATMINNTGPALKRLTGRFGLGPEDIILVADDVELPLGAVRVRFGGSDGGHKGVRSVLEAFGTDQIARVRLGVGRPAWNSRIGEHVSGSELSESESELDKQAQSLATERLKEIIVRGQADAGK